jgi:hypothetical protein
MTNLKPGYPFCPCSACQEVLGEKDGPRRPCKLGKQFSSATPILLNLPTNTKTPPRTLQ